jgi:hypothetical protein
LIGGRGGGASGLNDGVVKADDVGVLQGLKQADFLVDLLLCERVWGEGKEDIIMRVIYIYIYIYMYAGLYCMDMGAP